MQCSRAAGSCRAIAGAVQRRDTRRRTGSHTEAVGAPPARAAISRGGGLCADLYAFVRWCAAAERLFSIESGAPLGWSCVHASRLLPNTVQLKLMGHEPS